MKIRIKGAGKTTSLIVNDIELANNVSGFHLSQEAGSLPELVISIPIVDGDIDIELPDGVVIVEKQEAKNEAECNSADAGD